MGTRRCFVRSLQYSIGMTRSFHILRIFTYSAAYNLLVRHGTTSKEDLRQLTRIEYRRPSFLFSIALVPEVDETCQIGFTIQFEEALHRRGVVS